MIEVAPSWYFYSMNATAITTTPFNFLGVLIIIFCRKSQMASLRWHLLAYQICSMTTDFFINVGALPVIFTPYAIGRPHGIFTFIFQCFGFQTSTEAQCIMVIISLYITAGSVELIFFFRYQAILPRHHSHKLTPLTSIIVIALYDILLISIIVISFLHSVPDQTEARAQFAQLHPELQYLMTDEHVYILCVIVETVHVFFLASCFFRFGIGIGTVVTLIWMSSRALQSFHLSSRTRIIHLQLIKSLCYQITIPVLAFYGPLLVVVIPLMFHIPNTQLSFFISLICVSLHTFLGTMSMLYFNRHYRAWLISSIENRVARTTIRSSSKCLQPRDKSNANLSKFISVAL